LDSWGEGAMVGKGESYYYVSRFHVQLLKGRKGFEKHLWEGESLKRKAGVWRRRVP